MAASVPQRGGLHVLDYLSHRSDETFPDLLEPASGPALRLQPRAAASRPCATVFGYLPYWESPANIRWELITHVACFSVEVNSDGSLGNDHDWPWVNLINTAHANGVKVILVATLFDPDGVLALVTSSSARDTFFAAIKAKILEGDADGVNIDFEGAGDWRSHINGFMAELTAYLHAEVPGSEVSFAGPAVNWGNAWDLAGLAESCDAIFIMGYDFNGSWSSYAGPNAPLTGGSINITDTVINQYAAVVYASPEKLILGVPYYGQHWRTTSADAMSSVTEWVRSPRFRDAQPDAQAYGLIWDEQSQTPWYRWNDGTSWNQVWFDNDASLALKYDLAMDNGFQGIGMWALGYDGQRDELWDLLDEKFGGCSTFDDADRDGVPDSDDECPETSEGAAVDEAGCACDQLDEDGDTVSDCDDECPSTGPEFPADPYGCSDAQLDSDDDGVWNSEDTCVDSPSGQPVNSNGCAPSQSDVDGDGVPNTTDTCPGTPHGSPVDANGCADSQRDSDGDRIMDSADWCPDTPSDESANTLGCSASQRPDDGADSDPASDTGGSAGGSGGARGALCGAGVLSATALSFLAVGLVRVRRKH